MRILNDESNEKLDNVSIFLTREEAIQFRGYLNQLLENPKLHHSHLSSSDYKKEITICIYEEDNITSFNERSRKLILNDE
ncbi:MAG: hypothetical protein KBA81_05870 [Rhabdochlamydiaceae bacterium]|nr:hypothetical protein [Rhabdochlamydiaceae bacterium]